MLSQTYIFKLLTLLHLDDHRKLNAILFQHKHHQIYKEFNFNTICKPGNVIFNLFFSSYGLRYASGPLFPHAHQQPARFTATRRQLGGHG